MTDYYRMGRINEWLEDNECHKTDENKLDFYSIVQMRTLFRFWDGVSITQCRLPRNFNIFKPKLSFLSEIPKNEN